MAEALSVSEGGKVRHGLPHGAVCRKCGRDRHPNTSVRSEQIGAAKTLTAKPTDRGVGDRERALSEVGGKGDALRHP